MHKIMLAFILLFTNLAFAEDIYISQTAQGSDNGADCSNSHSASWFSSSGNWGAGVDKISAGDTAHLCGSISTALTIYGSGLLENKTTIYFEDNAKLSAPFWSDSGAIGGTDVHYIIINGGTNGLIEATDNGTALGNQVRSIGVKFPAGCQSCEIQNLTISNMYQRTPDSSDTAENSGPGIFLIGNLSNTTVHDNNIDDASQGVAVSLGTGVTTSNLKIYNNTISRISDGITIGSSGANTIGSNVEVYNNKISDAFVWDGFWTPPPGDGHHHSDGIQIWAFQNASITGLKIYNNTIGSDMGTNITGWIFTEGNISNHEIYNNLLTARGDSSPTNGFIVVTEPSNGVKIYNNTIISWGGGIGIGFSAATNADIRNNIFYKVGTGIFADDNSSIAISDYNNFFGLSDNQMRYPPGFKTFLEWQSTLGFDTNSITDDPSLNAFFSPSTLSSPVVDAGIDLAVPFAIDKVGILRPQGFGWDIGAHEYNSPPDSPSNLIISGIN